MPTSEALHMFCAELTNHLDDQPSSECHLRVVWIAKTLRECVQHQRELLAIKTLGSLAQLQHRSLRAIPVGQLLHTQQDLPLHLQLLHGRHLSRR